MSRRFDYTLNSTALARKQTSILANWGGGGGMQNVMCAYLYYGLAQIK